MKYYVYALLDPRVPYDNEFGFQPFYIGKGCGKRSYSHLKDGPERSGNPIKCDRISAIRSEGKEPIIVHFFETDDEERAYEMEESYIARYGVFGVGILTNLATSRRPPSRKGATISDWQKARIAEVARKRLLGKTYEDLYGDRADEVRRHVGEASKRRACNITPETRQKLSVANARSYVAIYGSEEEAKRQAKIRADARRGKRRTQEQRARIGNAGRGRPAHNRIPITYNGIKYNSLSEASKQLGMSVQTLSRHIQKPVGSELPSNTVQVATSVTDIPLNE